MGEGGMAGCGFSAFSLEAKDPTQPYRSNHPFTQQPQNRPLVRFMYKVKFHKEVQAEEELASPFSFSTKRRSKSYCNIVICSFCCLSSRDLHLLHLNQGLAKNLAAAKQRQPILLELLENFTIWLSPKLNQPTRCHYLHSEQNLKAKNPKIEDDHSQKK